MEWVFWVVFRLFVEFYGEFEFVPSDLDIPCSFHRKAPQLAMILRKRQKHAQKRVFLTIFKDFDADFSIFWRFFEIAGGDGVE